LRAYCSRRSLPTDPRFSGRGIYAGYTRTSHFTQVRITCPSSDFLIDMGARRDYCNDMSVPKKRMPAQERREYILEASAEVFSRKGYRMASVSDIVEEAGIGRGTFYLYFDSKREIFLELIEAFFRGYADLLQENHRQLEEAFQTGRMVLRTWRDNISRVIRYHQENPHLTNIVYREALGRDEDFSARVDVLSRLAREKLVAEFQMMYDRGMMRECDVEVVTSVVMGSTVYLIMEHVLGREKIDVEGLADMIVEYHIRALIPEAGDVDRALRAALAK
jgi:AcrR family transcriptional regulator